MRAQGLRPIQIWVPDTRSPRFAAACRRQSLRVAGDASDRAVAEELASVAGDLSDWKS
ncbi:MAG: antitoxin MazE family protein [Proteobacteria bacterium]|nr:antitoxin MazE family protein [Pseudomonadota bacterium]